MVLNKRKARESFLKSDIATLLRDNLDSDAYRRAEPLLAEMNLSSCYDLVEEFCDCILKQIRIMQKQTECPEECKEAIANLIYAAARFADVPELRELRKLFTEKYGSSFESFLNKEFSEKMAMKRFSMEKRLQLMQDISKEMSVNWDSKALENKLFNHPASAQDQYKKNDSFGNNDSEYKLGNDIENTIPKRDIQAVSSRGRRERNHDAYKIHDNGGDLIPKKDDEHIQSEGRQEFCDNVHKLNRDILPTHGRQELNGMTSRPHGDNSKDGLLRRDYQDFSPEVKVTPSSTRRQQVKNGVIDASAADVNQNGQTSHPPLLNRVAEDKTESVKPFCNNIVPPPYVKTRGSKYDDERDHNRGDPVSDAKPRPRSVRSYLKPPRGQDGVGTSQQEERRNLDGRKEDATRGPQTFSADDDYDSEEEKLDELLLHYSYKKPSTIESSNKRRGLKALPTDDTANDSVRSPGHRIRNEARHSTRSSYHIARAASVPAEPTTPTAEPTGLARANTFQPNEKPSHVHPDMPDYETFAERLAAFQREFTTPAHG